MEFKRGVRRAEDRRQGCTSSYVLAEISLDQLLSASVYARYSPRRHHKHALLLLVSDYTQTSMARQVFDFAEIVLEAG